MELKSAKRKQEIYILVLKFFSYDVASGSEITPCNKIDIPLSGKRRAVHNNVAYIMIKYSSFYSRNGISNTVILMSYDKYDLTFVLLYY